MTSSDTSSTIERDPSGSDLALARWGGWLLCVPIFALAAMRELWAPDEPRYAQVAREVFERESFLVMHLNGALYPDKPPLLYWLSGLFGSLFGWSELAMRVPSLAATAGSAWLCARLAQRFWGPLEAAWAGAFYLGTAMVTEIGGRLQIDPLLSFLCLASLVLATADARDERAARWNLWSAGLCLGLATLAKGPVAYVHVGLVLLVWRFLPRSARVLLPLSRAGWTGFGLLSILPVASWAGAASLSEPALLEPLFYGQHVGRVADGEQHPGPPWYHVVHLLYLVLPWTPLFALALWRAWREFRASRSDARIDAGRVRAASWFAVILIAFSVITPKRDLYLLPLYPAIALLCARELAEAQRAGVLARWVTVACAGILLAAGVGLAVAPHVVPELAPYAGGVTSMSVALATAGAAALVFQRRANFADWARSIFGGFAAAALVYALWLVPPINAEKSARALAQYLAQRPEKPTSIACVGVQPEGYRFYGGVPTSKEPLVPALDREGAQFLALVNEKYFRSLPPEVRARVRVLEAQSVGSRDVLVLGAALPRKDDAKARSTGG